MKLLGSQPSLKFLFGNHDVNKCFLLQIADLQADSVFFYFDFSVLAALNNHPASFWEVVESKNHDLGIGKGHQVINHKIHSAPVGEHDDEFTLVA